MECVGGGAAALGLSSRYRGSLRHRTPPPKEIMHLCMKREASEQKTENSACPTRGLGDA